MFNVEINAGCIRDRTKSICSRDFAQVDTVSLQSFHRSNVELCSQTICVDHTFADPFCGIYLYGPPAPWWSSLKSGCWYVSLYQVSASGEEVTFWFILEAGSETIPCFWRHPAGAAYYVTQKSFWNSGFSKCAFPYVWWFFGKRDPQAEPLCLWNLYQDCF